MLALLGRPEAIWESAHIVKCDSFPLKFCNTSETVERIIRIDAIKLKTQWKGRMANPTFEARCQGRRSVPAGTPIVSAMTPQQPPTMRGSKDQFHPDFARVPSISMRRTFVRTAARPRLVEYVPVTSARVFSYFPPGEISPVLTTVQ